MNNLNGFISGWLSHRNALIELLNLINDEHLSFRPWEKGMSFSELVLHIAGATTMFVDTVKNGEFTPPKKFNTIHSVEELIKVIKAETENIKEEAEVLTEDQLKQIIDFYGMKLPGIALLENAKDHEIHHKGQLFTYVRLLGIEKVPFFISR